MRRLAQSTSTVIMLKVFLASDHVSAATGKTVALVISKAGGAFANPNVGASNATEVSNGWYKFTLDTTDTNTLGVLVVRGTSATCDDSEQTFDVVNAFTGGHTALPAVIAGASGGLPLSVDASGRVDVLKINGTSQTARDIGASVLLSTGTGTGQLDFTSGVVKANPTQWLGTALATPSVAGRPSVDTIAISGDTSCADRLEAETDTWVTGTLPSQSGVAAGKIKLSDGVITFDTQWNGGTFKVTGGTGAGYFDVIEEAVASTDLLTMGAGFALPVTLDNTSTFIITTSPGLSAEATSVMVSAIWDEPRASHVVAGSFGEGVAADVTKWNGTAVAVPATAGVPSVDIVRLSGDATAADNAEAFFDGTGYAGTNNVIPAVTAVASVTGTIGGLTAAALANFFDTDTTTNYASAVPGSVVKETADNAGGGDLPAAIWTLVDGVEVGMTPQQAMRGLTTKNFGKVSGGQTGTEVFRNAVADTKTRITFTDDSSGNRTNVATDLT